ncbi:hypothetical protein A3Q56_05296 [Intoshia linei]|uniref:AN1-type zinc finger protein 4 n=1 Tax=Intoshia linei TaxID=1819745 RepID=A0A177AY89_9BILA|nr:hypothetical protein A3Q56_05296 [Intoshia linei]
MEIKIETIVGKTFQLRVSPFETVLSLKTQIQQLKEIPISYINLIWNSEEMQNGKHLIDYGLHDGATIKMITTLKGGPITATNTRDILRGSYVDIMDILENTLDRAEKCSNDSTKKNDERLDSAASNIVTRSNTMKSNEASPFALVLFREGDNINYYRIMDEQFDEHIKIFDSHSSCSSVSSEQINADKVLKSKMSNLIKTIGNRKKKTLESLKPLEPLISLEKLESLGPSYYDESNTTLQDTSYSEFEKLSKKDDLMVLKDKIKHNAKIMHSIPTNSCSEMCKETISNLSTEIANISSVREPSVYNVVHHEMDISFNIVKPRIINGNNVKCSVQKPLISPFYVNQKETLIKVPDISDTNYKRVKSIENNYKKSISNVYHQGEKEDLNSKLPFTSINPVLGFGVPRRLTVSNPVTNFTQCSPETSIKLSNNSLVENYKKINRTVRNYSLPSNSLKNQPVTFLKQSRHQLDNNYSKLLSLNEYKPRIDSQVSTSRKSSDTVENCLSTTMNKKDYALPIISKTKHTKLDRCSVCRRKLGFTVKYDCRCNLWFCAQHRYPEMHKCTYDYKTQGKEIIKKNNPHVEAPKLPKI